MFEAMEHLGNNGVLVLSRVTGGGRSVEITDLNFSCVNRVFDDEGELLEPAYVRRAAAFLDELLWMARTLRHGRDHIPIE